ncbi:MAG: hypothetical protein JNJ57_09130 [Saprospiraceae bacterium]|nr:hypothetical protein [Saprospiraceae bacterium]
MKEHKLLVTISNFSKPELRRLEQFLHSPYFNSRPDVTKLFQYLRKNKAPKPAEIYAVVYPDTPFDAQQLRLVMSYLQKLAEQFMAVEHWQATPGALERELTQVYRKRSLSRHFTDTIQTARTAMEAQALRNSDYFIQQSVLLWEEARFYSLKHPEDAGFLVRLSENADLIWLSQKLRYLCLHTAYRARYSSVQQLSFKTDIDRIVEGSEFLNQPAVLTWYYCLKMLEVPDEPAYFVQFKHALLENGQVFNTDEVRDLFLFAINYCIRRVNEGHSDFFHDTLDFYKDGLTKGHLFDQGVLSHFTYFNIVAAALHTRDFDWTETFIHQYRNSLERSYRDSAFSFNLARLEFARKRYDAVLSLLQHSNYHDPLLSMAAKTIALKIYYELNEMTVLEAHLEALIKYIRRKPGLGYHRNNYLNLARFTQKLVALNWNDKAEVRKLKDRIEQEQVLTEREWLLEQVGRGKG